MTTTSPTPQQDEVAHQIFQLQMQINFLAEQNGKLEEQINLLERAADDQAWREMGRRTA